MENWQDALSLEFSDLIVAMVLKHIRFIASPKMRALEHAVSRPHYNREVASIHIKASRRIGHTTALKKLWEIFWHEKSSAVIIVPTTNQARWLRHKLGCKIPILFLRGHDLRGAIDEEDVVFVDCSSYFREEEIDFLLDEFHPRAYVFLE